MATCKKCGADMDENAKQCPVCGAPVEQDQGNSNSKQNAAEAAFTEFNNTTDTTAEFDSKDITDNKVMAVLAYIGILFLIPLLAAPNSRTRVSTPIKDWFCSLRRLCWAQRAASLV